MIQGRFGEIGELLFSIDLINSNGELLSVEALLDTGFATGWLALDIQDAEALDWTLMEAAHPMQTASGQAFFALYEGKVSMGGQEFVIPVHAKAGIPEILLGLQWLREQRLVVDFLANCLTLGM
ncbi:aspartyl protease [Merismopedia glauca]|uniref:Aspartyl protease n=1 Tax=Merismopedia glauca CCAP 1448/3 TaxID=1296344 RepID=A0A2T1BZR6_9CYAN|nr:aspartyl protease [Merismopedia glauca]PSB01373.1 aspartyl protease [Merismopedia glauca CCAP 1448/3]